MRLHHHRAELLRAMDRPEITLYNNSVESDLRRRRQVCGDQPRPTPEAMRYCARYFSACQEEHQTMHRELARTQETAKAPVQKIEQIERRVESTEKDLYSPTGGHMLFFRGGYADLMDPRPGQVLTDLGTGTNKDGAGWYVGAGFDFLLADDLWGLWQGTSIFSELNLEYKNFNTTIQPTALSVLTGSPKQGVTNLTMLTISASPKLQFTQLGKLQPWIIPVGLDIHVISPPSDAVTYLDVGFQVGAGVEYPIWKDVKVGIDGRWHWTDNQTFTKNQFWTVGGYVGIGF